MADQCEQLKQNGARCRGTALPGKTRCFYHDPDSAAKRHAAQSKGGTTRSKPRATLPVGTPDLPLRTVQEVVDLLGLTINQVRCGRLDTKVGSCVGFLAGHLIAALKLGPVEERLARIEAQLNHGGGK